MKNAVDRFMKSMLAITEQHYKEVLGERIREGIKKAKKQK